MSRCICRRGGRTGRSPRAPLRRACMCCRSRATRPERIRRNGLLLGYAALTERQIAAGVARLAQVIARDD